MLHSSSLEIPDAAVSVAGLSSYLQHLLEQDDLLRQVWVIGEVSSAALHRSGLFFTLQDPDVKAAINCVVWSSQLAKLRQLPTTGEQLIVLGNIRLYPQRGQYQFIVWQTLAAGEGLQALRYRQLRDRLATEGLFDPERKRSLPSHPQTVAVVTSPQAAAWGDVQRTLKQRYPGLSVLFSPALVQGEQAPLSIVEAIERVERDGRAQVLILVRGGGAVEELACFNDERVIRAIANCSIPVITGIGHQRDESLADLVADLCAHTPTAAAEIAVPALNRLYVDHRHRLATLQDLVVQQLQGHHARLKRLQSRLHHLPLGRQLHQEQQRLAWQRERVTQDMLRQLQSAQLHCQMLQQKLASLDPQAVLNRGFAVVRNSEGAIVRSAIELEPNQELTIQLSHGQVKVKITDLTP